MTRSALKWATRAARWYGCVVVVATTVLACGRSDAALEEELSRVLRTYVTAQEVHLTDHGEYAADVADIGNDFEMPPGLTVSIVASSATGHSAIASQDGSRTACVMWVGDAVPQLPQVPEGTAVCDRRERFDPWLTAAAERARQPAPVPPPKAAAGDGVLAVGRMHACGVTADAVICWGQDWFGELGDGIATGTVRTATVMTDVRLRHLAAGDVHTCGLDEEGAAYCWGGNAWGELGDGTFVDRPVPIRVAAALRFDTLVAGTQHTCGLTNDGTAFCWGWGRAMPAAIVSPVPFRVLAGGTCGMSNTEELYCWETFDGMAPAVAATVPFHIVAKGYDDASVPGWRERYEIPMPRRVHVCSLTDEGAAYCWNGRPSPYTADFAPQDALEARLMSATAVADVQRDDETMIPVRIASPVRFRTVAVGGGHACGLTDDGTAYCWGSNDVGQLGDGTRDDRDEPVPVTTSLHFRSIAAAGERTCGVTVGDDFYCWGWMGRFPPTYGAVVGTATPRQIIADQVPPPMPAAVHPGWLRFISDHWGFTTWHPPDDESLYFRGPLQCGDTTRAQVEEGLGDVSPFIPLLVDFAPPGTSVGKLIVEEMLLAGRSEVLGGLGWRALQEFVMVKIPIEGGGSATDSGSQLRAFFAQPGACTLRIESYAGPVEGDQESQPIEAFTALRLAAELDPRSNEANDRGLAQFRAGRFEAALTEFKRAAQLDDRNAEALNNAGFALYRLGRLGESVRWYLRAMQVDPGRAVAFLNLGDSLEELGFHDRAVEAFQRYLELDPDGAAAERVRQVVGDG